jgi:hypothetical protein
VQVEIQSEIGGEHSVKVVWIQFMLRLTAYDKELEFIPRVLGSNWKTLNK